MKLFRYGATGAEKPGMLENAGLLRVLDPSSLPILEEQQRQEVSQDV